jgi:hypothetical protein
MHRASAKAETRAARRAAARSPAHRRGRQGPGTKAAQNTRVGAGVRVPLGVARSGGPMGGKGESWRLLTGEGPGGPGRRAGGSRLPAGVVVWRAPQWFPGVWRGVPGHSPPHGQGRGGGAGKAGAAGKANGRLAGGGLRTSTRAARAVRDRQSRIARQARSAARWARAQIRV